MAATTTAQPALQNITFPDWEEHYLPQGKLALRQYGRLLIDHVWGKGSMMVERPYL